MRFSERALRFSLGHSSLVAAAALVAACGESDEPRAPVVFAGDAVLTLASTPSGWTTAWRFSPSQPVRGFNAAELTVHGVDGEPLLGLVVKALPWMPAHGHGTSAKALVTERGEGVYVIDPVYYYMGGHWELRTSLAATVTAPAEDVTPSFDIK